MNAVPPSTKVTVPVGAANPAAAVTLVTVAVTVTGWPNEGAAGDTLSDTAVTALTTCW
jgi:hypothetical protein